MGNFIPTQQDFQDDLRSPVLGFLEQRAVATGTIREVHIWGSAASGSSWVLNMRVGGVGQWTGGDRPAVSFGSPYAAKAGLAIPVSKGARLNLDLEIAGIGSMSAVKWIVVIEEVD